MRMIPSEIPMRAQSAAEKKVHRLLSDIPLEGATGFWSVLLSEHEYKEHSEIDFIILSPKGIIVFEVKGGGVSRIGGKWIYKDRYGREHVSRMGPFEQARSARHALQNRLEQLLPKGTLDRVPFMWAVITPNTSLDEDSVEWDRTQSINESDTLTPAEFSKAIKRLISYSHRKYEKVKNKKFKDLTTAHIKEIHDAIRPEFEKIPSLTSLTQGLKEETLAATENQYQFLDACSRNERLLCTGGAGTGKTFLALESVRRQAESGLRVGFVCRSPILAKFFTNQDGMDSELIEIRHFAQIPNAQEKIDFLVVDEGQDIMNYEDLVVLDDYLSGGLSGGKWRIFLDVNHQKGLFGEFEESSLKELERYADSTINLPENCRNSATIVSEVEKKLNVSLGRQTVGAGLDPVWEWWDDPSEGSKILASHLQELLDQAISPERITILTNGAPAEDPLLLELPEKMKSILMSLNVSNITSRFDGKTTVSPINIFKGLENDFIFVTSLDSEEKNDEVTLSKLYVSMTRATAGLFLILPNRVKGPIEELQGTPSKN